MKHYTHAAEIVSDGKAGEVRIRETKRTWTDGTRRWPKFDRKTGEPTRNPMAYGTTPGGQFYTLMTDTIRALTAAEIREPLERKLEAALVEEAYARSALNSAAWRKNKATAAVEELRIRLENFDKAHGGRRQ